MTRRKHRIGDRVVPPLYADSLSLCSAVRKSRPLARTLAIISVVLIAFAFLSAISGIHAPIGGGEQEYAASVGMMADDTATHPHAEHGSSHHKSDHSHEVPALQAYSFDLAAFPFRQIWDSGALSLSDKNRSKLKKPPRISSNSDVQRNIRLENHGNAVLLSG
jgi:hypothetical protein